ncbi:MarR family transcriptional regulator [Pelagibacteraceae bacterium]|nr:MarR family transcriptional regulator [Pelagibacteraceae bacterium]
MKKLPSISSQINEDKIFDIINKNYSKLAPYYYSLFSSWLIRSYNVFKDIDKFIILIYLINKDLIFYRKIGLIIDYETFYKDKSIEIPKINISDISDDLKIPKESVRRKVQELEKKGVIKRYKKKIFVDRSAFITVKAKKTLQEFSILVSKFSEVLKKEKTVGKSFEVEEISNSIKKNFSFCWYQFYKYLFIFTNRWRVSGGDLESLTIAFVVILNTVDNSSFKTTSMTRKNFQMLHSEIDQIGINAMSISEITGIPRPTVVRKLRYLIKNNFVHINEKKRITLGVTKKTLREMSKIQDMNMKSLSDCLYTVFNQIKIINSN